MIQTLFLLCLSVSLVTVSAREARISLYEAATVSSAQRLSYLDCSVRRPSEEVVLPVNTCLWGDYFLVNNFKITQYPICADGSPAVALFYEGTSCTGKPTFRSESNGARGPQGITNRCLFGSSPARWSVAFRCGNPDSQSIAKGSFRQAIPPSYETVRRNNPTASGGVITPYFSYDCTISTPKQPTFLDADVCLKLEPGHSIHLAQPVVCENNKTALGAIYQDEECSVWNGFIGHDVYSDGYFASIDKKCYAVNAQSISFSCGSREKRKFEDLPPHEHKDVDPLVLLDPAEPEPEPRPEPEKPKPKNPVSRPKQPVARPKKPSKQQDAQLVGYWRENCQTDQGKIDTFPAQKIDTCFQSFMYDSVRIQTTATCGNGTKALLASYSRPGCHPEDTINMGSASEGCIPTKRIGSLAFWCDGLSESEIGNRKGSIGGLIKILLVIFVVFLLITVLTILSCVMKGAAMIKQAGKLIQRLKALFGKDEGGIRLEDDSLEDNALEDTRLEDD